ncbi:MAG: hypothetical protein QM490_04280 [Candidatus Gracilibacteria bacterium]
MTTTYQIRVDKELKNTFLQASKDKGLDGSMLIRYFMKSFTNKPEIVNFDIREDFFDIMMNDTQITSKLEKISNKLDKIGF